MLRMCGFVDFSNGRPQRYDLFLKSEGSAGASIRVPQLAIAPGPVYTPMVYVPGMSDERREARRRSSALGIEGTGWDIGYAALFLVSDEARYITGVTLPVDGGWRMA